MPSLATGKKRPKRLEKGEKTRFQPGLPAKAPVGRQKRLGAVASNPAIITLRFCLAGRLSAGLRRLNAPGKLLVVRPD
jgi:hypothetical protein